MPTTVAAFVPLSLQSPLDRNGTPMVGARVFAFDAGTTNARTLYQDAALSVPYRTPVLSDGFGRIPPMFAGTGAYKVTLQDPNGALLSTVDGLPGATVVPDASTTTAPVIPTGFYMAGHTSDIIEGWVIANGRTIGSQNSGATARAAADAQALYSLLWNNDPNLAVTGGRGLTAASDFTAGKALTLPDMRGRTLAGRDSMVSGTAAGVLSSLAANADVMGFRFGADTIALTSDQLAAHNHAVTLTAAGGHAHTGTTDNQGSHQHVGSVDAVPDHTHGYTLTTASTTNSAGGNTVATPQTSTNNTQPAGGHAHTYTTSTAGGHVHAVTTSAVADHTHTVTQNTVGSGNGHSNTQPSMLTTWYIKL